MYKYFKSCVDIIGAFLGVVIFTPLFLFLIICIDIEGANTKRKLKKLNKWTDENSQQEQVGFKTRSYFGGAILGQERIGKDEKRFYLYKFRSMTHSCEKFDLENQTISQDDKRVTFIGKFIRRFKIDELLQLVNVLKGEMSLVGPRPLLPTYEEKYEDWMKEKFKVRPGMTGLAQVNGGTYLSLAERSYFDVYYVRKLGLFLDIKILLKTIPIIIFGEKKYKKDVSEQTIKEFIDNNK